jgi:hypothetical protein
MGNNSSIDLQFMGELQTKVDCYKDCLCKGRILENGVFVDKCPINCKSIELLLPI